MIETTTGTTTRLLDLLEMHAGWDLIDGGEVWTVTDWIAEWQVGAEAGDRGPAVTVLETSPGHRAVVALDEVGRPAELVGLLAREG
jgi:hypothetical protein